MWCGSATLVAAAMRRLFADTPARPPGAGAALPNALQAQIACAARWWACNAHTGNNVDAQPAEPSTYVRHGKGLVWRRRPTRRPSRQQAVAWAPLAQQRPDGASLIFAAISRHFAASRKPWRPAGPDRACPRHRLAGPNSTIIRRLALIRAIQQQLSLQTYRLRSCTATTVRLAVRAICRVDGCVIRPVHPLGHAQL